MSNPAGNKLYESLEMLLAAIHMGESSIDETQEQLSQLKVTKAEAVYNKKAAQASTESEDGKRQYAEAHKAIDKQIAAQKDLLLMKEATMNELRLDAKALKARLTRTKKLKEQSMDGEQPASTLATAVIQKEMDSTNENERSNIEKEQRSMNAARVPAMLPMYGRKGIEDPQVFIDQFEARMIANRFPRSRWGEVLPSQMGTSALIKKAMKWIERSWDDTRELFLESQLSKQVQWVRRQELARVNKSSDESVREYTERFEELLSLIPNLDPDDPNVVMQYTMGLQTHGEFWTRLETAILANEAAMGVDLGLDGVINMALSLAAKDALMTKSSNNYRTYEAKRTKKPSGTCTWCAKEGHSEIDCRGKKAGVPQTETTRRNDKPAEPRATANARSGTNVTEGPKSTSHVKCHGCGEMGHYKSTCPTSRNPTVRQLESMASLSDSADDDVVNRLGAVDDENGWLTEILDTRSVNEVRRIAGEVRSTNRMQWLTPCKLGGQNIMAVVDSGATISVVSHKFCLNAGLVVQEAVGMLQGAFENQTVPKRGTTHQILENGVVKVNVKLAVADLKGDELLIGTDLFTILGYNLTGVPAAWPDQVPDSDEPPMQPDERDECRLHAPSSSALAEEETAAVLAAWQPLLVINAQISEQAHCTYPGAVLCIPTGAAKPKFIRQYPTAKRLDDTVTERVTEWLQKGWIERSIPGNPWSFPLHAVPKKDGNGGMTGVRLCLDLRELNTLLENEQYPIPRIGDLLIQHNGNRYFATLDQADSYHQWLLNPDDKAKVAFIWNGVHYNFVRACFGVKTMTSLFQRIMTEILEGIGLAHVYIDDIIIGAPTLSSFIQTGVEVLQRLNQWHIKLRFQKCVFGATELVHLGRLIGRDGFRPEPHKIKEIMEWTRPSTYKALKSFNCLAGYYRDHVRDFATIISPLTSVQERTGKIHWTSTMLQAFDAIRALFGSDTLTLAFPDFSKPMEVHVDASLVGMGAVLLQEHDGVKKMISAISRAFRGPEVKYSATKRELRAVVWTLLKFEQLLLAGRFILYTDHRALTFLLTQKHQNPMIERWVDKILQFDFEIRHIAGAENIIADALSRQYDRWKIGPTGLSALPNGTSRSVVALMGTQGVRSVDSPIVLSQEELLAEERGKTLVPLESRTALINDSHQLGHFGEAKMFSTLWHNNQWWPTMRQDIHKAVANCEPCIKFNVVQQGYHEQGTISSPSPWWTISIDLIMSVPRSPTGETCCLVVVCVFTRFVILRALFTKEKQEVASALWKLFADFGFPRIMQTDNGGEFVNEVMECLRRTYGIHHRLVAAYNHQANGVVERMVRTVTTSLKKQLQGATINWPMWLPITQMAINMATSSATGTAPFMLMFGRKWNPLQDYRHDESRPIEEADREIFRQKQEWLIKVIYPAISQKSEGAKRQSKIYQDRKRRAAVPLEPGAVVYALDPLRASKWHALYEGPYEVLGRDDKKAYILKDLHGTIVGRHFTSDQLKPVNSQLTDPSNAFVVEMILDHDGTELGGYDYLVKWKSYPASENSWEPQQNFVDWHCIQRYWRDKVASPGVLGLKKTYRSPRNPAAH
jgi:hypothetical protein